MRNKDQIIFTDFRLFKAGHCYTYNVRNDPNIETEIIMVTHRINKVKVIVKVGFHDSSMFQLAFNHKNVKNKCLNLNSN